VQEEGAVYKATYIRCTTILLGRDSTLGTAEKIQPDTTPYFN
jgi:hypothetical protein